MPLPPRTFASSLHTSKHSRRAATPLWLLAIQHCGIAQGTPKAVDRLAPSSTAAKWFSAAFGALLLAASLSPAHAGPTNTAQLKAVQALDARAAAVMYRLTSANPDKCPLKMPGTGIVLHTLEQYPDSLQSDVRAVFGFETPLAIAVVVPGSPAEAAGLKTGDSILAINGTAIRAAEADEQGTSLRRDAIERELSSLDPRAALSIDVMRSGETRRYSITPKVACRTRHEVRFGSKDLALSDGDTIQFSDAFVSKADDNALAVIAAHELAHTALEHNRKLEAQGINDGLLRGFGRNARIIRAAEDEADRTSIAILAAAGYDPAIAPAFWRGAGRKLGSGILRSRTHGKPAERAQLLDQEILRWQTTGANSIKPDGEPRE